MCLRKEFGKYGPAKWWRRDANSPPEDFLQKLHNLIFYFSTQFSISFLFPLSHSLLFRFLSQGSVGCRERSSLSLVQQFSSHYKFMKEIEKCLLCGGGLMEQEGLSLFPAFSLWFPTLVDSGAKVGDSLKVLVLPDSLDWPERLNFSFVIIRVQKGGLAVESFPWLRIHPRILPRLFLPEFPCLSPNSPARSLFKLKKSLRCYCRREKIGVINGAHFLLWNWELGLWHMGV